jgi:hypothetical protein
MPSTPTFLGPPLPAQPQDTPPFGWRNPARRIPMPVPQPTDAHNTVQLPGGQPIPNPAQWGGLGSGTGFGWRGGNPGITGSPVQGTSGGFLTPGTTQLPPIPQYPNAPINWANPAIPPNPIPVPPIPRQS